MTSVILPDSALYLLCFVMILAGIIGAGVLLSFVRRLTG